MSQVKHGTRFHHFPKSQLRAALMSVRDDLRSGAISAKEFDMDISLLVESCGTVGCIGGHAALRLGMEPEDVPDAVMLVEPNMRQGEYHTMKFDPTVDAHLHHLFYVCPRYENNPRSAARRIDEYLDLTGEER